MEVIVAKSAGFCFGVQRALDTVEKEAESCTALYTYGPIIHNERVVKRLAAQGVRVMEEGDAPWHTAKEAGGEDAPVTIVIRSHGVARKTMETLEKSGYQVIDATCPFVKKIHHIVEEASGEGHIVIVVGAKDHPEVLGITGWANGTVRVVETPEEANRLSLPADAKVTIVAQTTYNHKKFKEAVEIFSQKGYNISVANTICPATNERQTEAAALADSCDAVLVIGDHTSSNTRKLFEICAARCERTYFIRSAEDLADRMLDGVQRLGITAGASAPKNIIEEVQTYVRTRSDV